MEAVNQKEKVHILKYQQWTSVALHYYVTAWKY